MAYQLPANNRSLAKSCGACSVARRSSISLDDALCRSQNRTYFWTCSMAGDSPGGPRKLCELIELRCARLAFAILQKFRPLTSDLLG
jgi:hypothetical protein